MNSNVSSPAPSSCFNNPNFRSQTDSIREHDQDSDMADTLSSQFTLVDFNGSSGSSLGEFNPSMSPNDLEVQGLGPSIPGDGHNTVSGCHQGSDMDGLQHWGQRQIPVNLNHQNNDISDTQRSSTDAEIHDPGHVWTGFNWILAPDGGSGAEVDSVASIPQESGDLANYADTANLTVPEVTTSDLTPTDTHDHAPENMRDTMTDVYSRQIPYQNTHHDDRQDVSQQENDGLEEQSVEAGNPTNEEDSQPVDVDESPDEKAEQPVEEEDHRYEGEQAIEDDEFQNGDEGPASDDGMDGLFKVPEPHNHDLRPGFRDGTLVFTTWLDRDASGNYDPNFKAPRKTARKRRSTGNADSADVRRLTRTQNRLSEAAFRVNGNSHVISFKFSSDRGKALLAAGTDNWADDEWNVLADPLQTAPISATSDENDDDDDILDPSLYQRGYKLRARRAARVGTSTNRPNLQGQPMARGCWGCYETGFLGNKDILNKEHGCSLAHDSTDWPCSRCTGDDQECELITPAKVKKSCDRCNKRKVNCSYTRSSDHSGPCLECQEVAQYCIAGPNKSAIPHRISLDDPTAPPERDVLCTECLKTNKKCTLDSELRNKTGRGCRNCEKKGNSCIIADQETPSYPLASEVEYRKAAAPQKKRKATGASPDDNQKSQMLPSTKRVKVPCPPCPPPTTGQRAQKTKTIATKLCHPIQFCCESSCHFCEMPSYRVLGLGPVRPTVIDKPRAMFTELENGHHAQGQENTRICPTCTFDLAKIIQCGKHDLLQIPPYMVTGGTDYEAAFNRLISGNLAGKDHWCQLCPAMAEYACGKKSDVFGDEVGCGLKLCFLCASDLQHKYNYEMDRFMDDVPNEESSERPFGLRADAELLRPDGQLGRFLECLAD